MTAKRFHSEDNCCGYYTEIIDKQKELDLSLPNPKKNLTIEELVDLLNNLHEENEKLKLHLHILEEVVYMLDQEVVRAMEDGFESSDWYPNYLAKGTEDLE
jgi:hypothetical protein